MISRRLFVGLTGIGLVIPSSLARAQIRSDPFTLGVASGSPCEDSVILWTRLAPDPLQGGGMPSGDVEVRYRVWEDVEMRRLVREGNVSAPEADAHSVHLKLNGLKPGREYWYRFSVGDYESTVGRTRTISRGGQSTKLALANCQNWQSGYFAAYADMADWAPDCVIHVGDYIYEGGVGTLGSRQVSKPGELQTFQTVRQHNSAEIATLWDYRNRYALYKGDPSLQAAHAASPWIVSMDDHEVDNNWAASVPQDPWAQTQLEFKVRKLAAFKAWYEHMPVERPPVLNGIETSLQMYGAYRFGPAKVHLLDTRQHRSDQVCGSGFPGQETCVDRDDPSRTLLGKEQEEWLTRELKQSDAKFNVLASQIWMAPYRFSPIDAPARVNMDAWDGYPAARSRLLETMGNGVANPIVLSGDWHCAAAMTIHADPNNVRSKPIGHEFAGTSISSDCGWMHEMDKFRDANPHVRHLNARQRGYCRFDVSSRHWTTSYRVVDDPYNPKSVCRTDRELRTHEL